MSDRNPVAATAGDAGVHVTHEPGSRPHPGVGEYIRIALILAVATAAEVSLYYLTALPDGIIVALLMFFMIVKFGLVALWFMHLRFDSRVFRRLFVTGIVLAVAIYGIVLFSFRALFR